MRAAAEPADFRQVVAGETIAFVSYVEDAGTEYVGVERDDGRELAAASLTTHTVDASGQSSATAGAPAWSRVWS